MLCVHTGAGPDREQEGHQRRRPGEGSSQLLFFCCWGRRRGRSKGGRLTSRRWSWSFVPACLPARLQFGATPLMIAVSSGIEVLVATLLNSWRPRVNVNARKPVRQRGRTHEREQGGSAAPFRSLATAVPADACLWRLCWCCAGGGCGRAGTARCSTRRPTPRARPSCGPCCSEARTPTQSSRLG